MYKYSIDWTEIGEAGIAWFLKKISTISTDREGNFSPPGPIHKELCFIFKVLSTIGIINQCLFKTSRWMLHHSQFGEIFDSWHKISRIQCLTMEKLLFALCLNICHHLDHYMYSEVKKQKNAERAVSDTYEYKIWPCNMWSIWYSTVKVRGT